MSNKAGQIRMNGHGWRTEAGVALFACLMILLILSLLGISAMRMMASQTLIAASSQAADISYSAGSSIINRAITEGVGDLDTRLVLPRVGEAPRVRCLIANQSVTTNCSTPGAADTRGVSTARVTVSTINPDDDSPAQAEARLRDTVARVGSVPGATVEYFTFTSEGEVNAMGISVTQVQETVFPHL